MESFLKDIDTLEDIRELFPDIKSFKGPKYFERIDGIIFDLIDNNKLGFLAEVLVKERNSYEFDEEGEVVFYAVNPSISRILYCYGDTLEELLNQIYLKSSKIIKGFETKEIEE